MSIRVENFESLSKNIGVIHNRTNIGIVNTQDGIVIIDSGGNDFDGQQILNTVLDLYPTKTIIGIFNTHSHSDHCGGNAIIKKTTNAKIYASYNESKIMEFPSVVASVYWGGAPFKELEGESFVAKERTEVDVILTDEEIEFDSVKIKSYPLPGHFFDQVGILVEDKADGKKAFFLGDGFFGTSLIKKFWIPFMLNEEEFRESILKITKIPSDYYIPGHGDVYLPSNVDAAAELNLLITIETELLIQKLLKDKALTQEEILKEIADYSGLTMKTSQYILIGTTLRSYLSCLSKQGVLKYQVVDNRLVWSLTKNS